MIMVKRVKKISKKVRKIIEKELKKKVIKELKENVKEEKGLEEEIFETVDERDELKIAETLKKIKAPVLEKVNEAETIMLSSRGVARSLGREQREGKRENINYDDSRRLEYSPNENIQRGDERGERRVDYMTPSQNYSEMFRNEEKFRESQRLVRDTGERIQDNRHTHEPIERQVEVEPRDAKDSSKKYLTRGDYKT